jgi:hypothetical protein
MIHQPPLISCINQDNDRDKQAGVEALGAILDRSESLLAIISDGTD